MDVGEFIVPIPHVKQVKLSKGCGRLIIASDGIWDALTSEIAASACRGLPSELAARQVVKVIIYLQSIVITLSYVNLRIKSNIKN